MEKISRMAVEVNKLVGSSLLSGSSVYIPQSGSLKISKSEQGIKSVILEEGEQGESLIEIIRQRASCTEEQASEIFRRWREEVGSEALMIKGVGEIGASGFIIDERFAARLNPVAAATTTTAVAATTTTTVAADTTAAAANTTAATAAKPSHRTHRSSVHKKSKHMKGKKKKSYKGIVIIVILLLLAIVCYFAYTHISKAKAEKAHIEAIAKEKAAEQRRVADSIALAQAEVQRQAEAEAALAAAVPPRYRLIYGIYELRSNVDVAIALINKRHGEGSAKEYPFGVFTMVSIIESDDRNVCQRFLMDNYNMYPDSWVYDSQK